MSSEPKPLSPKVPQCLNLKCLRCGHKWEREPPLPMELGDFVALLGTLEECPNYCGARGKEIAIETGAETSIADIVVTLKYLFSLIEALRAEVREMKEPTD